MIMDEVSFFTKIFIGDNALDRLKSLSGQQIFIVTDPFIEQSGMLLEVTNRLDHKDNEYHIFSDIVPDPPIETVAAGVKIIQELRPNVIIAIGGGSAIDAAKAMKDFSQKLLPQEGEIKLIAIPTTSGTGSEVTSFSVITDAVKQIKYPLVADALLPDEAILDTTLIKSVPPSVTADTGMDVLTHALEAYVSTKANDFSDALAEKAVQLIFDYLPRAFRNGNDVEAREKVHHASCLAGMAFNMVGLGINHSIAHVCGAQFHIPHGRMNAILLPSVLEYNAELQGYSTNKHSYAANKYAKLAKIIGFPSTNTRVGVKSLIQHINKLEKELQLPASLRACGITLEQVRNAKEIISEVALNDRCTQTNPRIPLKQDIEIIIEKIY
jgi:1-propanol dehydrogenase